MRPADSLKLPVVVAAAAAADAAAADADAAAAAAAAQLFFTFLPPTQNECFFLNFSPNECRSANGSCENNLSTPIENQIRYRSDT